MSIVTFFVSPLNMFLTRYYKETFMGSRVLFLRLENETKCSSCDFNCSFITVQLEFLLQKKFKLNCDETAKYSSQIQYKYCIWLEYFACWLEGQLQALVCLYLEKFTDISNGQPFWLWYACRSQEDSVARIVREEDSVYVYIGL